MRETTTTHIQAPAEAATLAERVDAAIYEPFLWLGERLGMARHRRELLAAARGEVLEIGAGTGLNLGLYPAAVSSLVLLEPVEGMARRLEGRLAISGRAGRVCRAPAERLPFADDSFDTVVSTLVLCTVEDPERALAEIERVLRPDGQLLFIEHLRSDEERWARWLDRLEAPWASFGSGCRCNQPTLDILAQSRLRLARLERASWKGMPRVVRPLAIGAARP
ncbi:MAG TPA: class I SAM-dependent methyltransferase [Thermoleophilaceae bacterium]|nr:class I SAM-dependent methyltransferase [Thermoleophilaceae bacterium]